MDSESPRRLFTGFLRTTTLTRPVALICLALGITDVTPCVFSAEGGPSIARLDVAFEGPKSAWHGFDCYAFLLDEENLGIETADESSSAAVKGKRRCIVVVPKTTAPGSPWSWRGCYWDHQPHTEIEFLKRGFHVAYITADASLKPDKKWDAWYEFLTEKHGLSKRPAFIGMSRGGEYAYIVTGPVPYNADGPSLAHWNLVYEHLIKHGFSAKPVMEGAGGAAGEAYAWAVENPDRVSCIYAENPVLRGKMSKTLVLDSLAALAKANVPLFHVCGSRDPWLDTQTRVLEKRYRELGGQITVMINENQGHYPLAPNSPGAVVDLIANSVH